MPWGVFALPLFAGCAGLARSDQENGTDAATEEFAASVESSRRDQLTRLGQG
ncbi:hypothetical protein SK571_10410 [Lentzea sp. BCCO 10_0798]|uniref:Uncharacterized protein n=1 Tax=Lentzea kristufekii TaxID=3095430 RepID=A0ABU4TND5_9PSEU|nr:hypothetical protein [Lentzea sp. BCCO 10_0798]MDX8049793.1 hypothetical protein [Lentzea sp. BCCO 10_0798]